MRKRLPLVVAGWLVTGLLATGAGVAVIDRLSEPLTTAGLRPLSAAEVDKALALASSLPGGLPTAAPTAVPTSGVTSDPAGSASEPTVAESAPQPAATVTATPVAEPGESRVITTAGGRVIARCKDGLVTLRSWSPAQGFQTDDVERGPADRARVEFESEETEVKVEVNCAADGSPVHRVHS
ncbi:hypothetical protein OG884_26735 [Streptosporangium sp. NBC_01755]|uniref:hypothetical protein n=1 Tax=unclassified Streptosporangium TaxID=2632669 RepID=UPI002DDA2E3D|nr:MULTISPECIES: hypothetical protein [unclassified Streptosporangium]WSA23413.1 hypothetical protein OIE13_20865 [Streptosporangium sp. NBC_01810]WSC98447.1 hypothetical protein OG884_26735 [Streptosporangium sp. NBC_01755]